MKAGKVTLKHMLSRTLRGKRTILSYGELCTYLVQAAKVVNDRPVTQESFTTNKSEDENTDGLLEKHAIKKTVGVEIDRTEYDDLEKTLMGTAGQRDITVEEGVGHDPMKPTLKDAFKMVEEHDESSKAGTEGVGRDPGSQFYEDAGGPCCSE